MKANEQKECTGKDFHKLLSYDFKLNTERVIITGNFRSTLRINKEDWKNYFPGFGGLTFKQGKEIEIVSGAAGGPKTEIPDWIRDRLNNVPGSTFCITEKKGRYFFKKLNIIKLSTKIPGYYIIDFFENDIVNRTYSLCTDYNKITKSDFEKILSTFGRLSKNPLDPFRKMDGIIGYLARKEFLDGHSKKDVEFVESYRRNLEKSQFDNGSWENNTMITAFNLIEPSSLYSSTVSVSLILKECASSLFINTKEGIAPYMSWNWVCV